MKIKVWMLALAVGVVGAVYGGVNQAAVPTDVYLLIGQSNMAGRGDVSVEKVDNSRLLKWGDSDAIEVRNLFAYK